MNKKFIANFQGKFAAALILLGCMLLFVNFLGLFFYTTIDNDHPNLWDKRPRTISETEFWSHAYRYDDEKLSNYLERLTKLVSDRMLLIDKKYAKPTFFENWILWVVAQQRGDFEWINSKRAVRLGGGFCSQHAIVFDNILKEQSIASRILGLNGHVLNEVLVDGHWRVYDPDFNVIFHQSMKELEASPEKVFQVYRAAGLTDNEALQWQKIFSSDVDNWHFGSSISYSTDAYIIEKLAFYFVWVLPGIMILIGLLLLRFFSFNKR